ncbi:hypothetical protein D3C87_883790 [compost metagenome]
MNQSARDTPFKPDGYRPYEKVTLLAEGTTSPTWDGLDVDGNRYTSKQFDGKYNYFS